MAARPSLLDVPGGGSEPAVMGTGFDRRSSSKAGEISPLTGNPAAA